MAVFFFFVLFLFAPLELNWIMTVWPYNDFVVDRASKKMKKKKKRNSGKAGAGATPSYVRTYSQENLSINR